MVTHRLTTAVIEWVISFGFTFYLLTFAYDLRLSKGVHKFELSGHEPSVPPPAMRTTDHNGALHGNGYGNGAYQNGHGHGAYQNILVYAVVIAHITNPSPSHSSETRLRSKHTFESTHAEPQHERRSGVLWKEYSRSAIGCGLGVRI